MKVVFLDFDGVLNNDKWIHAVFASTKKYISYQERQQDEINPAKVKLIDDFVNEFDAQIVVSSSWRITHTLDELNVFLTNSGMTRKAIDVTPRDYRGYRGAEVKAWLRAHPEVTHYVIFDDDRDFDPDQNFVNTSWSTGVEPEHINEARKYLS